MITKEGVTCKFSPMLEDLHTLNINWKTDSYIFRKEIVNNKILDYKAMCYLVQGLVYDDEV